jgi:hypothetical protein
MAITTYCTQAAIEDLIGTAAVTRCLDDNDDGVAEVPITKTLERAALKVNQYSTRHYSVTAANDWITGYASVVIAATMLFRRRGNAPPAELQDEYDAVVAMLEDVYSGKSELPMASPKAWEAPSMSNLTIDGRYNQSKVRVQDRISIGDAVPGQNTVDRYLPDVPTVG